MPKKEWLSQLEAAARLLASAHDVPDWLRAAMKEIKARADALDPLAVTDEQPSDFFYPH